MTVDELNHQLHKWDGGATVVIETPWRDLFHITRTEPTQTLPGGDMGGGPFVVLESIE